MSRKQKDYLSALLKPDDELDNAEPLVHHASPLLSRTNSLGRIASGELKQVPQVRLDPKRCRIWSGNARNYAALTYERCNDLIESMIAEGGQKVPALVRKLRDDPDHDYEVVYGTRRHWAISWLRANSYPDFVFVAEVRDIDDESAFRLADLENRARRDISEIERAKNYAMALPLHYDGKQVKMAERLRISKSLLSKMIAFASIDDRILGAFSLPGELSLRQGYNLAQAIVTPEAKARVEAEADVILKETSDLAKEGKGGLRTDYVLSRLLNAATGPAISAAEPMNFCHEGRAVVTVLEDNRRGVRLLVHRDTGASLETIVESLTAALRATKFENSGD